MPSRNSKYEVIPSASRLIQSLRNMGYDFSAAVADLVDNSIEAGASTVTIDVHFDGDESWVRIADNGRGMKPSELLEAMRYGSKRDYGEDDLGRFGLGLKTASLSQCRRLTLTSRPKSSAEIAAFCWDLEHIQKTDRWTVIPLARNEIWPGTRDLLKNTSGTVVLWERLDRILGYKHPYGETARARLSGMCRDLEEHLAMVFHRFLAGDVQGKQLKIILNENEVQAWDPFARTETKTKALKTTRVKLEYEGTIGHVTLEPFVLPHQTDFSTPAAFRRASGPANWNQQQGFYIYRANRLIQSGGWSRLRTADEHTKLARVALSFSPSLDDAFKINVAKMRVQLPSQIKDGVEGAIKPVIQLAQKTYRKKATPIEGTPQSQNGGNNQTDESDDQESDAGDAESQESGSSAGSVGRTVGKLWSLAEIEQLLMKTATPNERPVVMRVVARLRDNLVD